MSKADKGPNLQELADQKVQIAVWCPTCSHPKLIPVEPLLARVNELTSVIRLAHRLTCSSCGGQSIETRPHHATLGVVAEHRWRHD